MQSFFGRAKAVFSRSGAAGGEPDKRLGGIVGRQRAIATAARMGRLSGNEEEQPVTPLYDSSAYNSIGSGFEEPEER